MTSATNLMCFTYPTINWMEMGLQIDVIHTDFKKAFDRLCHNLLIRRLKQFGFDGILLVWFESYLRGRPQFVKFNNFKSAIYIVSSGVPQGSHLGPLFFIIFLNFVSTVLIAVYFLMYADDVKIFLPIKSLNDCHRLQSTINTFSEWCSDNKLDLNISKCKVISFTRKKVPIKFDYTIFNQVLSRCNVVKDLGVYLDDGLTMNHHVNYVTTKARKALGFIKRFSKEFNEVHILKTLYFAYVRPILEYCSIIWSPHFKIHTDRLEAIQRNFSKFALRTLHWNNPGNIPSYEIRLKLLETETLSHRRKSAEIMFINDLLSNRINCSTLLEEIHINASNYCLRNRIFAQTSSHRTCYGYNNPFIRAQRSFNEFYVNFDFTNSRQFVKKKLRNHGLFGYFCRPE